MRIYKYGKTLKVIGLICALILLFFSVIILFTPNNNEDNSRIMYYIFIPFSIFFFPLSILAIRDVLISRVIITDSYISSTMALSSRKLRTEEIQGFKRGKNYIHVIPKKQIFKKKLKFSLYLNNVEEIITWLSNHSNDFDLLESQDEVDNFYKDSNYGFTSIEKEKKLKLATKVAKIANTISVLCTVVAIFFKDYKMISAWVLTAIPLVIIGVVYFFKGLIKFTDKEEDEVTIYPSVFWGFSSPIFLTFLVILNGIDIYEYENFWTPFFLTSLVVFIFSLNASKEYRIRKKKTYGKLVSLFFVCLAYGYVLILFLNITLDKSKVVKFKTAVIEKDKSTGKTTSYYLYLNIIELKKAKERYYVSSDVYEKVEANDSVFFMLKKGQFNIPYYSITSQ